VEAGGGEGPERHRNGGASSVGVDCPVFAYGKGFAAAFLLAVTAYGGGTRAQIPTARSPITNGGVGELWPRTGDPD
jgi:hypothetical protein